MSPQPSPISPGRLGLLLGLVFTLGVVLVGLSFLGQGAELAAPAAKSTQLPPAKGQLRVKLRSAAFLNLDESKNVRPDAPELGPTDLNEVKFAKLQALAEELGYDDKSRFFGISASAEKALDEMMNEPRWKQLEQEIETLAESWPGANQEERQVILDRTSAGWDQVLIEARRRLPALR
jgi:hypothetical protein